MNIRAIVILYIPILYTYSTMGTFKQASLKFHRILRKFTDDKALRRSSASQICHEKLVLFWEIKKWFKASPDVAL